MSTSILPFAKKIQINAGVMGSAYRRAEFTTYLSWCAEFTGLSVKLEYGSPTTRNATQCLGQLRKKRMPSLYYAYFLS